MISPKAAERLNLRTGQMVRLHVAERAMNAPVWILAGHPDDCISLHLGQGHTRMGIVADGVGVNGYQLRSTANYWHAPATIEALGEKLMMVSTQKHRTQDQRGIAHSMKLAEFTQAPQAEFREFQEPSAVPPSLYPEFEYKQGPAWGMVVDLTACIGCNACVVACQAENNIPVVGKEQVAMGREMLWLRIDQYNRDEPDHPQAIFQPMMCVHCEKAPCELVCPVAATVHDGEGLNVQIYNRCIGTRYCSNNCPYKVRHFNFLRYSIKTDPLLALVYNPDVTVRSRGVMEKCTYCLQRISAARIASRLENRQVGAEEVLTACQAACPTNAIIFGNLNAPDSPVRQLKAEPHNYNLLGELNTQPRTSYLARIENPNPDLEARKT